MAKKKKKHFEFFFLLRSFRSHMFYAQPEQLAVVVGHTKNTDRLADSFAEEVCSKRKRTCVHFVILIFFSSFFLHAFLHPFHLHFN